MSAMTCGLIFAGICGGGFGALIGSLFDYTIWGLIIGASVCMGFMWITGRLSKGSGNTGASFYGDIDGFD